MKKEYTWNPVYNLVMKIKKDYQQQFDDKEKLFSQWLLCLNKKEYNNIFDCLQTNQYKDFLLIRYGLADMQSGMWEDENSIYRECRSIVIDLHNEELVLTPFRKFFNINEVKENDIDNILKEIKNANIFEISNKLDGSMQSARWYQDKVFMAGSMALEESNSWRLKDGYSKLTKNHEKMIKFLPEYTFIFEYISIKDAHVVLYEKKQEGLYLIGVRDTTTGEELTYKTISTIGETFNVPVAEIENINIDEVLTKMKQYKSYEKEGWVLNIDGHKVKIKCDDYVQLHKLLDKFSSVNMIIENIAEDRIDDMVSKVPDNYKERIFKIANRIIKYRDDTIREVNQYYEMSPKADKKEFMIWVTENCPKYIKSYVRNLYLNKPFNVLKKGTIGYKKLGDLNISESYSALFSDLEEE